MKYCSKSNEIWLFFSFFLVQPCKEKHHTNSLIQMRISSCVSIIRKMCSHLCASAMRCSTVDCTCCILPMDLHVSHNFASRFYFQINQMLIFRFIVYSAWHFHLQSSHSNCISSRYCKEWNLTIACLCCCSKYFNHRSEWTWRSSQTKFGKKTRINSLHGIQSINLMKIELLILKLTVS